MFFIIIKTYLVKLLSHGLINIILIPFTLFPFTPDDSAKKSPGLALETKPGGIY